MAHGLGPCFYRIVPKLEFPGWVWELVVRMLQPNRSIRNPTVPMWFLVWALTFPNCSQSLNFQVWVWELVVRMLQSIRSIRNPKVPIWLLARTLAFPRWSQSFTFQVWSGSWLSNCGNRTNQLEIQKYRYGPRHGPLLFQTASEA